MTSGIAEAFLCLMIHAVVICIPRLPIAESLLWTEDGLGLLFHLDDRHFCVIGLLKIISYQDVKCKLMTVALSIKRKINAITLTEVKDLI